MADRDGQLKFFNKRLEDAPEDGDYSWDLPEGDPGRKNCLSYWYPRAKRVLRTPLTREARVPYDCNLYKLLDGKEPLGFQRFVDLLVEACALVPGDPVFLRTGHTSGHTSEKHRWAMGCHLAGKTNELAVVRRISALTEDSALKGLPCTWFYAREMLPTRPIFDYGSLPVTREFRLKLEGQEVTHIQPYWPPEVFEERGGPALGWQDSLRSISALAPHERDHLVAETLKLRNPHILPEDDWSVDWLQSLNGTWHMIDMALAQSSYWWEPDFPVVAEPGGPAGSPGNHPAGQGSLDMDRFRERKRDLFRRMRLGQRAYINLPLEGVGEIADFVEGVVAENRELFWEIPDRKGRDDATYLSLAINEMKRSHLLGIRFAVDLIDRLEKANAD